ncbi:isoleucyl-tRNA synthetase [Helicobacter cinaedi CCUG 18818 = ATCC BAA-847]|uniref:Isoleucine--tRNA ligase n=1 Tax=Helicobacter cinaedi CCUG 18818 = ATCC BAA-847 TaxID=537971 RepID=A0AAI8MPZ0_9HELI|nr:isoleucine--tRNA ligase [Helicobacter cinaedi]BAM33535.1 isoleucyl-tRNA synthetase [Helicobacter cinaedi CCUG 18818 = ATCC BAA-847]
MDYKETLILPQTTFPMRGNLPQNEPQTYAQWKENNLYERLKNANKGAKSFTLHDGPPYANGHLHIGHALNKILKDIIVKYHYFKGENIRYTPGWDCHGLPIEQQVEQKIGKTKKDNLEKTKLRELCRNHAQKFIEIQSEEFQALGVLGDFSNPYKTMDFAFEAQIYRLLIALVKEGLLAERSKPIYWSWACESALADAEVEYQEKQSDSIFVSFNLADSALSQLGIPQGKLIIWTTTPWTLPANVAISLNPNESYVLTLDGYIVAKALHSKCKENLGIGEIAQEFSAKAFENLEAINPLNGRTSLVILGEHVSMSEGSGAVHTAPGHGEDDYYIGLKYNLPVIMPVDDKGNFSPLVESMGLVPKEYAGEFVGKNIFETHESIFKILGSNLLKKSVITHSYPHCWRSHKPVIYRATTQWFILLDKPFYQGKTLKELALSELDKVRFYPQNGKNRIYSMIENRPDWCISRQRDWGVPIAFLVDKDTNAPLLDIEVLEFMAEIFEKQGCDAWWSYEIKDLLPQSHKHLAQNLSKSKHILDVWFDSGSTWSAVLKNNYQTKNAYDAGEHPADMYLEGSDQHRGWFQSSLLLSCAVSKIAPYKQILTHGFTFDRNGEKMSKSKGNVIAPSEIIKTQGSEILRLWVALSQYQSDQNISDEILKQVGEQYRKIRNTIRFLLANADIEPSVMVGFDELGAIDRWILQTCDSVFEDAYSYFDTYDFAKAFQVVMNFLSNELSGIYLDLCKDILYCDRADSVRRRAILSSMVLLSQRLLHFIAPVLTYTANEAFSHASLAIKHNHLGGECKDIFELKRFACKDMYDLNLDVDFALLLNVRESFGEVLDNLKKQKSIKSSLEVEIVYCRDPILPQDFALLDKWLIVSRVYAGCVDGADVNVLGKFEVQGHSFAIRKAQMAKCERCWQFVVENGVLCERCSAVVATL